MSLNVNGVDINALQKDKKEYRRSNRIQKSNISIDALKEKEERIVIVFKNFKEEDISTIETKYEIQLNECIARSVCIFKKQGNTDLPKLFQALKNEYPTIRNIHLYQKYHFKHY